MTKTNIKIITNYEDKRKSQVKVGETTGFDRKTTESTSNLFCKKRKLDSF